MLTIPQSVINALVKKAKKTPYFPIFSDNNEIYMDRHWLIKPNKFSPIAARIHTINKSDADRHLHDHPWANCSVLLEGGYYELVPFDVMDLTAMPEELAKTVKSDEPVKAIHRKAGDVVMRKAYTRHRLIVPEGARCVSLFITAKKSQEWGFYVKGEKIHHTRYLSDENSTKKSMV